MTFEEILDQAIAMLQRRGRLTYRTLKLQFQLDDEHLEALKDELIYGQRLAVDEDERVLVWTGETSSAPTTASPGPPPTTPDVSPAQGCQMDTFFILEALGVCWGLQLLTAAPRATS